MASLVVQPVLHTVPHLEPTCTSKRPSSELRPPANRTCTYGPAGGQWEAVREALPVPPERHFLLKKERAEVEEERRLLKQRRHFFF